MTLIIANGTIKQVVLAIDFNPIKLAASMAIIKNNNIYIISKLEKYIVCNTLQKSTKVINPTNKNRLILNNEIITFKNFPPRNSEISIISAF